MNPWELRQSDERNADTIFTVTIYCEDAVSEKYYFESFANEKLNVRCFPKAMNNYRRIKTISEEFRQKGLLEVRNGKERIMLDEGAQVWCVFDRDKNTDDGNDTEFNDSIQLAKSKGIHVAWSNDAFELWILLHFEDVNPQDNSFTHRSKYNNQLTSIFKNIETASEHEKQLLNDERFKYEKKMKNIYDFPSIVLPRLQAGIPQAIRRAEKLEKFHSKEERVPHQMTPCTMVHYLVRELIKLGK